MTEEVDRLSEFPRQLLEATPRDEGLHPVRLADGQGLHLEPAPLAVAGLRDQGAALVEDVALLLQPLDELVRLLLQRSSATAGASASILAVATSSCCLVSLSISMT